MDSLKTLPFIDPKRHTGQDREAWGLCREIHHTHIPPDVWTKHSG